MYTSKVAFITGITGQDGSYLARLLLKKGYEVHGLVRRSSSFNTARIDDIYQEPQAHHKSLFLHYGDMTDGSNLISLICKIRPHEIYNLAAQSHVKVSFETPEYTANADGLGTLRLLEAIRILGLEKHTRFYQASTSELYGANTKIPQCELTAFSPRSPYAAAKLYAYWMVVNYRQAYALHASNGILFNHESPLRGATFVTKKITRAAAAISLGQQSHLHLGNLNAMRDWGHAKDYVEGMWLMLQQETPNDYVLATGKSTSVRSFATMAFKHAGIELIWSDTGLNEKAYDKRTGNQIIAIDPRYYRPTEVDHLQGNAAKAKQHLNWSSTIGIEDLIMEMVEADLAELRNANYPLH